MTAHLLETFFEQARGILHRPDHLDAVGPNARANGHDPDPEMRPYKDGIDAERREKLTLGVAVKVTAILRIFLARAPDSGRTWKDCHSG
jgi:hypothetical protein